MRKYVRLVLLKGNLNIRQHQSGELLTVEDVNFGREYFENGPLVFQNNLTSPKESIRVFFVITSNLS
jgi:hypothetical protein